MKTTVVLYDCEGKWQLERDTVGIGILWNEGVEDKGIY